MKKYFTLLFSLLMSVHVLYAEIGTCGENLSWNLTDSVLTINGTGTMDNYDSYSPRAPWYQYRESISTVILSDGITKIGNYAFDHCIHLSTIVIPESVKNIGKSAFAACYSLTSLTIPSSVTSIGVYAFNWVPNIVYSGTATWQQSNPRWGARSLNGIVDGCWVYSDTAQTTLIACSAVAKGDITIPSAVVSIQNYALHSCMDIISVTIPNSVSQIGLGAFEFCTNLISVTIPSTVTNIGRYCFDECTSLQSVFNYSPNPQTITSDVFDDVNISDCKLYVPEQSVQRYRSSSVWREFVIESIPPTEVINNIYLDAHPTKVLRNGQVLIIRGDKTYTLQGHAAQ